MDTTTGKKRTTEILFIRNALERAAFSPDGPRPQILQESDEVKVLVAALEPGQQIPVHPESLSVYYFIEGTGWMTVDGERYEVSPGATLILPHGATRGMEARTRLVFLATRIT